MDLEDSGVEPTYCEYVIRIRIAGKPKKEMAQQHPAFAQQPAGYPPAQQQQQMPMPAQQVPYQQAQQQAAPAFAQPQQQQQQQQQQQVARPPVAATATQNGAAAAPAQAAPAGGAQAQGPRRTLPAFDLYLDLPHPAASSPSGSSPNVNPPRVVVVPPAGDGASVSAEDDAANQKVAAELSGDEKTLARIARFAFPEFDDQAHGACCVGFAA